MACMQAAMELDLPYTRLEGRADFRRQTPQLVDAVESQACGPQDSECELIGRDKVLGNRKKVVKMSELVVRVVDLLAAVSRYIDYRLGIGDIAEDHLLDL